MQIDFSCPYVKAVLPILLMDRTTGDNILWVSPTYGYPADSEIQESQVGAIIPRCEKPIAKKKDRAKNFAEVYTPSWIANKMNNMADEEWTLSRNRFNREADKSWTATKAKVRFKKGKTWQDYILSTRLEITCGEGTFLVSRYDAITGNPIPIKSRIGLLDRKLRIANENTTDETNWLIWSKRAYQSTYGYEYQGDSLLIARANFLMSFVEYLDSRWNREPTLEELEEIATIISWNLWQMDGIKESVPFKGLRCTVYDWRENRIAGLA